MYEIDGTDAKILQLLQKDGRMSVKELSGHVCLSSPAVSARLERLRVEGILVGYQAIVDDQRLGNTIKAFINLEVEPLQKPEFYPYIQAIPNVVECNCVTGDYSMHIEVLFPSTVDLDQFIGRLQRFGRTRTQIVFSTSVEHRGVPPEPRLR